MKSVLNQSHLKRVQIFKRFSFSPFLLHHFVQSPGWKSVHLFKPFKRPIDMRHEDSARRFIRALDALDPPKATQPRFLHKTVFITHGVADPGPVILSQSQRIRDRKKVFQNDRGLRRGVSEINAKTFEDFIRTFSLESRHNSRQGRGKGLPVNKIMMRRDAPILEIKQFTYKPGFFPPRFQRNQGFSQSRFRVSRFTQGPDDAIEGFHAEKVVFNSLYQRRNHFEEIIRKVPDFSVSQTFQIAVNGRGSENGLASRFTKKTAEAGGRKHILGCPGVKLGPGFFGQGHPLNQFPRVQAGGAHIQAGCLGRSGQRTAFFKIIKGARHQVLITFLMFGVGAGNPGADDHIRNPHFLQYP